MLTSKSQESPCSHVTDGVSESPLVVISILNWNGWQDTLECLESVRRLDYPNYLTVVIDNGSWNGSADKIKDWGEENLGPGHVLADYTRETALAGGIPETEQALDRVASPARLVLMRNEENLGFTGGNNVSIHYALHRSKAADYVFLLNNDAKPDPDSLSQLVQVDHDADAGIIGASILDRDGKQSLFAGRAPMLHQFFSPLTKWQLPPPKTQNAFWHSFYVSGSAMLVQRSVLLSVLRMHGEYLKASLFMYADEIVLSSRAHKAGHQSVVAAKAFVRHDKAASSGGLKNPLVYYYPTRNMIHAAGEVLPFRWRALFYLVNAPLCLVRVARKLAKGDPRAGWAIMHGLIDGYRGVGGKWKHHDQEVRRRAAS